MTNAVKVEQLFNTAQAAASQSDRVLFVLTLLVMGICAIAVARYFVKQHEQLIADHKLSREAHQEAFRKMSAEQSEAYRKVCDAQNVTIIELTKALTLNQVVLMEVKVELQKLNKSQ